MFESELPSQSVASLPRSVPVRVRNIMVRPAPTWEIVAAEPFRPDFVYGRYVAVLSAIGPLCWLVANLASGHSIPGFSVHPVPPAAAIAGAVTWYILGFVGVYVAALLLNLAAPWFGGRRDFTHAFLLIAYASTPAWLGGIFALYPPLRIFAVPCALYGAFLLFSGLPPLLGVMGTRRTIGCIAGGVIMLGVMALAATAGTLTAQALGGMAPPPAVAAIAAQKPANTPAVKTESGKPAAPATAPDPQALVAVLPESFRGVARADVTTVRGGTTGIAASTATASYAIGRGVRLSASIVHAASGIDATAAMDVNSSDRNAVVTTVDGTMSAEVAAGPDGSAYTVKTPAGVVVSAKGQSVDMATLKALVTAVDMKTAERLAK